MTSVDTPNANSTSGTWPWSRPVSQILPKGERLLHPEASPPPRFPRRVSALRVGCRWHASAVDKAITSCGRRGVLLLGASPRRASPLSGKRSGDCPNADDDPPLVIQDMDLFSSLAFELSHTENPTPNGVEVRRRMTLPRQGRPIPADQAEVIIRHSVSSFIALSTRNVRQGPRFRSAPLFALMISRQDVQLAVCDQPAVAFATVLCDFRSKNKAWLITALTESALNGLVIRNAGSGAWPVRKRSGKAVMKMTGTS